MHVNVNILLPGIDIVITSLPDIGLLPVQAPDALQLEVFKLDQFKVISDPIKIEYELDDKVTDAEGDALLELPPPPQLDKKQLKINK